jgi:protein PhnA
MLRKLIKWFKRVLLDDRADQALKPVPTRGRPGENLSLRQRQGVAGENDEWVYDEATGEWRPAAEMAASANTGQAVVRDAAGNTLADGDSVTLIKDLKVKGTNQTLKQGTIIKSIRLTNNDQEIDCRYEGIKGLVLRTEFVRKR